MLPLEEILALPLVSTESDYLKSLECSEPVAPGLWLQLYHGRKNPDMEMDDWGESGPYFGPFDWMTSTYNSEFRFGRDEGEIVWIGTPIVVIGGKRYRSSIFIWEDMIYYNGMFYGDWSIDYVQANAGN